MTTNDDSEDLAVEIRPVSRSKKKKGEPEEQTIIENDEPIPLFPNLDKDARNVITLIRVNKRSPPNDGYKGDIHPSATLDFIAKRFGNGLYDLEAMNQQHQVLRRTQNIKIDVSMDAIPALPQSAQSATSFPMAERLLERQSAQFEADSKRSKEISDKAMEVTQTLTTSYADMIREDSKTRTERDREYFSAQNKQQMAMMQALLLQTQQMHQQAMSAAREGFQQTMQMMQMQHQHSQAMNNPVLLLSLFKEGLALGQSTGEPEDALSTVLKSGVMGLGHIKDMMGLQSLGKTPSLPGAKVAKLPNPSRKPGAKSPQPLTTDELRDLIRLKKLAQAQGQDFHEMVLQAQKVLGAQDEDTEATDGDNSDNSGEDRESEVEGGKPAH